MPADPASGTETAPLLSVVRGKPTEAEVAAVVVVLGALASRTAALAAPSRVPSRWSSRSRQLRPHLTAGAGAWRASGLPG